MSREIRGYLEKLEESFVGDRENKDINNGADKSEAQNKKDSNKMLETRVILARIGEIALKGQNRSQFISRLMKNIRRRIKDFGDFRVEQKQSRIWIKPRKGDCDLDGALEEVVNVFGLVSASIAWRVEKDPEQIREKAFLYAQELLKERTILKSFKVEARRSDKAYEMDSPMICEDVGAHLLTNIEGLHVDVHKPDFTINVEIRDEAYIYSGKTTGLRGLPVGTSDRALLLLSGGIDSPVAGFMMASRGMVLQAIYFHTFPYTGDEAKEKVLDLARQLKKYAGRIMVHVVNFTDIQLELKAKVPPNMLVIIMRRFMMRIASAVAESRNIPALITGESLGQVASQTAKALACTNEVSKTTVFRPLIGMDKQDTIELAKKIGTYETSILPYEDCCTVFVAKHPKLEPELEDCLRAEEELDVDGLVSQGLENIEIIIV